MLKYTRKFDTSRTFFIDDDSFTLEELLVDFESRLCDLEKSRPVREAKSPTTLFVRKLLAGGLSNVQIIVVLDALNSTCRHCFDGDNDCQCENDE